MFFFFPELLVWEKTKAAIRNGVALVLAGAGFTATGVGAGLFAAMLQVTMLC